MTGPMAETLEGKPPKRLVDSFETSDHDERKYRLIKLDNGAEFFLVQAANKDGMAVASVTVQSGYFSDDRSIPGMAHAVEHIVISSGSKKYPAEYGFIKYIRDHGGKYNAETLETTTTFYFQIRPSFIFEALDRLAHVLTSPTFYPSTIDSELQAVDSEHKTNLPDDKLRLCQVQKSLSNSNHPWSKFGYGTYSTLKASPDKLREFFEKYYSASRMKFAVIAPESLDRMEERVIPLFSDLRENKTQPDELVTELPLRQDDLLTQCFVVPITNCRLMCLEFPFLDETSLFECQPSRYLCHIIGNLGPGSIFSSLKNKRWVTYISASINPVCPHSVGIFECRLFLTPKGISHWEEVIATFFQYLTILKQQPPEERIFDELKTRGDNDFEEAQKIPPIEFARKTSSIMHIAPYKYLVGGYRLRQFNPALIQSAWEHLSHLNCRVVLASQHFECNQEEPWFGTKYSCTKMSSDLIEKINTACTRIPEPQIHLPLPNKFLLTNVGSRTERPNQSEPEILLDDAMIRCWYEGDFREKKSSIFIHCKTAIPHATAKNAARTELYIDIIDDAVEKLLYDAQSAGLEYQIKGDSTGITIQAHGCIDVLSCLVRLILSTLRELEPNADRFKDLKNELFNYFMGPETSPAFHQANWLTIWLTNDQYHYSYQQLAAECDNLEASDFEQPFFYFVGQMQIEAFFHGNISTTEALDLISYIKDILNPTAPLQTQWPITQWLAPGANFVYHKALDSRVVNNCVAYLLYLGDTRDNHASALLLAEMIDEDAQNQLRAKDKLGYIVSSSLQIAKTSIYYCITIEGQSPPAYMEGQIDCFLMGFIRTITEMHDNGMDGGQFGVYKSNSVAKCLKKPDNSREKSELHWSKIIDKSSDFHGFEIANKINQLTKDDIISFYTSQILPSSVVRSKLIIKLTSPSSIEEAIYIENVGDIKFGAESWRSIPSFEIEDLRDYKCNLMLSGSRAKVLRKKTSKGSVTGDVAKD